ncbi:hypothetical protein JMN11_06055 [Capnocytophaga genosp. AHN8471]|uniref:DUF6567 family protein n=1 Tax=Capnocytophaga genosp. AHN8471 TaxID=327574 RepID=UPI001933BCBD|nr:DUF6567 family protein [Capnocytophaga genosp. AHN8471]MBM0653237.1 hypothetical protein [Capnocytophaga genosp. AHN8471]
MKKIILFSALALLLSSCGVSNGLTHNLNNHTTQVVLAKNNFKVVEHVKGEATNDYFLLFGGGKKALIEKARAKMLENANLVGSSKAVINETVEIHSFWFIGTRYTVTVSADVIEFTE